MQRTINMIIGLVVAIAAAGLIFRFVGDSIYNTDEFLIFNNISYVDGDLIIITWETSSDSDGVVKYNNGTDDLTARDYDLRRNHRVTINKSAFLVTTVPYTIKSCNLAGKCYQTDERGVVI